MDLNSAFFQAVLAEPDDDTHRLVFADWLDDHGEPERAEFIRVQCQLARLAEDAPERGDLERRERELLAAHVRRWNGPVHRLLSGTPLRNQVRARRGLIRRWEYRRGFIESVRMDAEAFADHADVVFRFGPVRCLRLRNARSVVRRLADCPRLAALTELDLSNGDLSDAEAAALARSSRLSRLRSLSLSGNQIRDAGAEALAASPALAGLSSLDLGHNGIGFAGVRALANSGLRTLRALSLDNNRVGAEGARALAASEALGGLTTLSLRACGIDDNAARVLVESPRLARLTELYLEDNPIRYSAQLALRRPPHLAWLRILWETAATRSSFRRW